MKLRTELPPFEGATAWINGQVEQQLLVGDKPILVHFWSVSCHLCKVGMDKVNHFRDQYKNDLHVVAVHMPRSTEDLDLEKIERDAKQYNITQPIFVDGDLKLTKSFDNKYVPAYYLFDKTGILRHYQAGASSMNMLEKRLNRLLEEAPITK